MAETAPRHPEAPAKRRWAGPSKRCPSRERGGGADDTSCRLFAGRGWTTDHPATDDGLMPLVTAVQGDITQQHVDAVVNAANSSLLGGGGVDGAIHRAGGPEILNACRELRAGGYGEGLGPGQAVATTAGRLPATWVIHTVGPVWSSTEDRSALLASCYRASLRVAEERSAATVAFPAISTGAYGWPLDDGARIAVAAVREADSAVREVRFVLFDDRAHRAFASHLR